MLSTIFEKSNAFLVKPIKICIKIFENDNVFLKNKQRINRKLAWFHRNSVHYVDLKLFCVNLNDLFWENHRFFSKQS